MWVPLRMSQNVWSLTTQLYNQNAQIVYAPTSQSMMGAATAAQKMDKYLIAQDTDLYNSLKESDPEPGREYSFLQPEERRGIHFCRY